MRILAILLFATSCFGQRLSTAAATAKVYPVKNEVDVYILAGQSNAQGDGTASSLPAPLQATLSTVKIFDLSTYGWNSLLAGTNNYARSAGQFGPEVTFGKLMADYKGKTVYIIKYAEGSTLLGNGSQAGHGNWNTANTSGNYVNLKVYITRALGAINALGYTPRIRAMLWMQGEADAQDVTFSAQYQTNLESFIAGIRAHVGLPNMPFVLGKINANISPYDYRVAVRSAQVIVGAEANCYIIDTDSYGTNDGVHYNTAACQTLGNDYFNICKDF